MTYRPATYLFGRLNAQVSALLCRRIPDSCRVGVYLRVGFTICGVCGAKSYYIETTITAEKTAPRTQRP